MTEASKKANPPLKHISSHINYLVKFKKDQTKVQALIDSDNKINIMTPTYMAKLGLKV